MMASNWRVCAATVCLGDLLASAGQLHGQWLYSLVETASIRPPRHRPVSYLSVPMRPIHLSCLRKARCLEGVRRFREACLPWLTSLGTNFLGEPGRSTARLMYSVM